MKLEIKVGCKPLIIPKFDKISLNLLGGVNGAPGPVGPTGKQEIILLKCLKLTSSQERPASLVCAGKMEPLADLGKGDRRETLEKQANILSKSVSHNSVTHLF